MIEILVVVSIIVLLIAILLPSLRAANEAARRIACSSNLRQFGIGIVAYTSDHDGHVPVATRPSSNAFWLWGGFPNCAKNGHGLLFPNYLNAGEVSFCPSTDNPLISYDHPNFGFHRFGRCGWTVASSYRYRHQSQRSDIHDITRLNNASMLTDHEPWHTRGMSGGEELRNVLYLDGHIRSEQVDDTSLIWTEFDNRAGVRFK